MSSSKHTSGYPIRYKDAKLDFNITQWQDEKNLHGADYFKARAKLLNHLSSGGKLLCCHFCGFPDGKFLEIHHLDGDHKNWEPENLVPACSLCHQMHHLGWVGLHNLGRLIYIPTQEINGPQLNKMDHKSEGKEQEDSGENAIPILPYLNLYQRFYLLRNYRTRQENKVLDGLPMSSLFETVKGLMTAFGFETLFNDELEYTILRDGLNEDRRKSAALSENNPQSQSTTPTTESSVTQMDAPKKPVRGSVDHIATSEELTKYEKELEEKSKRDLTAYITNQLHLLDFVETMAHEEQEYQAVNKTSDNTQHHSPMTKFQEKQKSGESGVFAIEFNPRVLKPWDKRLGYTLKERIAYYKELGLIHAHADQGHNELTLSDLYDRLEDNPGKGSPLQPLTYAKEAIEMMAESYKKEVGKSKQEQGF